MRSSSLPWLWLALEGLPSFVQAQQSAKIHRIGVIYPGAVFAPALDSLRAGLRDGGLVERKHYLLHIRSGGGDLKAIYEAARALVDENVDLFFTTNTSVSVTAMRATKDIPIVFYAGSDPVRAHLVESYAKPGGARREHAGCAGTRH